MYLLVQLSAIYFLYVKKVKGWDLRSLSRPHTSARHLVLPAASSPLPPLQTSEGPPFLPWWNAKKRLRPESPAALMAYALLKYRNLKYAILGFASLNKIFKLRKRFKM